MRTELQILAARRGSSKGHIVMTKYFAHECVALSNVVAGPSIGSMLQTWHSPKSKLCRSSERCAHLSRAVAMLSRSRRYDSSCLSTEWNDLHVWAAALHVGTSRHACGTSTKASKSAGRSARVFVIVRALTRSLRCPAQLGLLRARRVPRCAVSHGVCTPHCIVAPLSGVSARVANAVRCLVWSRHNTVLRSTVATKRCMCCHAIRITKCPDAVKFIHSRCLPSALGGLLPTRSLPFRTIRPPRRRIRLACRGLWTLLSSRPPCAAISQRMSMMHQSLWNLQRPCRYQNRRQQQHRQYRRRGSSHLKHSFDRQRHRLGHLRLCQCEAPRPLSALIRSRHRHFLW